MKENIVEKGQTAQNEQFQLFPQCFLHNLYLNSLPNNKILDWSKLKAFADDKKKLS